MEESELVRQARVAAQETWVVKYAEPAPFKPNWTMPPGQTLRLELIEREETAQAFAKRSGLEPDWLALFFRGQTELTQAHAKTLANVMGISEELWLNMERDYREGLERGAAVVQE